jgi:porin
MTATGLMADIGAAWADPLPVAEDNASEPTFTTGLFSSSRSALLGDLGRFRTVIGKYGLTLGITETSEIFGNVTGGVRQGADYDGLTTAILQLDTLKAFGLAGGLVNISAFQIHGTNLSAKNLLALQTVSGIEANRSSRLWEVWYQQAFSDGRFDIKVGQQSADQEFITSINSALFANTMMGWPLLPSYDQYAGGPAYPLSSLAIRLRAQITPTLTSLIAVYDDNPPGEPFDDDSQTRGIEAAGLKFNLKTGALFFGELQYALNQPTPGAVETTENAGLPGTYKIGFWADTASYPSQSTDSLGLSLANPASTGLAASKRGNFSLYGVIDQVIWKPDYTDAKALSIFVRAMGAPSDRNLISFSLNGGLTLKGPLKGRDNDTVGIGVGYGRVSSGAQALDAATAYYAGPGVYSPVRTSETFIEATYQYQIASWWQLQPDVQYIFNPGGGIVNPLVSTEKVQNEMILGLRTNITF